MLATVKPAALETQFANELAPTIGMLAEYVATCSLEQGAATHSVVAALASSLEDIKKALRDRMLDAIRTLGKRVTDKGTLLLTVDGWELEARPTRTGVDAKRLEAALRSRGVDPGKYMQATIGYKVDNTKLQYAISDGVLTVEEIGACSYEQDQSYSVQPPRRVGNE